MRTAQELARTLADVGRAVRDAVRAPTVAAAADARVLRHEGGDDVFGIDARAHDALLAAARRLVAPGWPGTWLVEGIAEPVVLGEGPWRYLVDPLDGTRSYLAGKRSAWVLIGAGRLATTLEDLEVGAAVEVPTGRAAVGLAAWAARGERPLAEDDDLVSGLAPSPVRLVPRPGPEVDRAFVTVARFAPGAKGPIGAWEDALLAGLEVWEDSYPCTGGQLLGLATGADAAVLDPRPLFAGAGFSAHPYDLAALVVARAAGVVVEALPPGPLDVPLDLTTPVAWAGYANEAVARRLRPVDVPRPDGGGSR
ncbi:MAG: hypothetical protein IPM45_16485 [Acidimicrobiales bacterium]|nr:hypothetical protein [Acidimicrobiales bacterium]